MFKEIQQSHLVSSGLQRGTCQALGRHPAAAAQACVAHRAGNSCCVVLWGDLLTLL